MTFKNNSNNKKIVDRLQRSILSQGLHHAYLIEGPRNIDKLQFTKDFIQAILCKEEPGIGCGVCATCRKVADENNIDVMFVRKERSKTAKTESIKTAQVDDVRTKLLSKPYDGDRNIAVFVDADTMSVEAYNKLLKTLEEPPEGTVIILLSENVNVMPQTIISRAIHLRLSEGAIAPDNELAKKARNLVDLIEDKEPYYKMSKAIEAISKGKKACTREEIYQILDCMEAIYREYLLMPNGTVKKDRVFLAIKTIEETRKDIMKKINTTYSLKNMVLTIGG